MGAEDFVGAEDIVGAEDGWFVGEAGRSNSMTRCSALTEREVSVRGKKDKIANILLVLRYF